MTLVTGVNDDSHASNDLITIHFVDVIIVSLQHVVQQRPQVLDPVQPILFVSDDAVEILLRELQKFIRRHYLPHLNVIIVD